MEMTPSARGEWQHEFQGVSAQGLDYADVTGSAAYAIGTQGWSREQYLLSPGPSLALPADWKIDLEMGLGGSADQRT